MNLRRPLKYLAYAFTLLIIGVAAFSAIEYAQGVQPFLIVSDSPSSMSPIINYGDAAMMYRVPFDSLRVGDIIAFKDPRGTPMTIIHRIVAVENVGGSTYLVTKGDNSATNPINDPWRVTQQDYLSKAIFVVPLVGYVSPALWGFTGAATFLPFILVLLLVIFFAFRGKKKETTPQTTHLMEVHPSW